MRIVTGEDIAAVLTPSAVIDALDTAFRSPIEVPLRHHHPMPRAGEPEATLLLMPAWHGASAAGPHFTGIKIVSVVPGNAARGKATVIGSYLLMDGLTGAPLAVLDGRELTLWRTAAASALAASYLARPDARRLLMIGAGALAPFLIHAHAARRGIDEVEIWNRDPGKAAALAARLGASLAGRPARISAVTDLDAALGRADIVSAATLAGEPLVRGERLAPGTHVDLVGGFTPDMREADDAAILRAELYADTRAGACHEAGDLVQPIRAGLITEDDVRADLFELCRGAHPGRTSAEAITLFKSVGTALEDLAAAALVIERLDAAA